MTREDMLQKLYTVPFILIDPAREWEDIGFTERDIWVDESVRAYRLRHYGKRNIFGIL